MINNRLVNISLSAFAVLTLVFVSFPELDIEISGNFYDLEHRFIHKHNAVNQFFFRSVPILTNLFVTACLAYILFLLVKYKDVKLLLKSSVFFLLVSASIGPGLIAHGILKENFGRARPRDIVEFAGNKEFVRAGAISDQCSTNCSFVSGHAAMAFYFTAIAYIINLRYFNHVYMLSLLFGTCVGGSRIAMGGHFASDVTAAAFLILFFNHVIYILWKKINSN